MLKDVVWASDGTYRPGEKFSPERFFNDGLKNSCSFDLQLGYFSSATISVLAEGFATFISKGGNMRLVINQIVSEEDKEAITEGMMGNVIDCMDLSDFNELRKIFDEYQEQFFKCLSYLIVKDRIDIRIIKPKGKKGIAHTKSGQFRDGETVTSFTGSANFTISGLFNNIEEIKIDRSDSPDIMTQNRIVSQKEAFDAIMNGERRDIEYLSAKELEAAVASCYHDTSIDELLDVEQQLDRIRLQRKANKAILEGVKGVSEDIHFETVEPHFPYPSGPREYQQQAFENWKNNGQKGLFAMATGTGKTITSLNCLLEIYKRKGYYKAIILVPTVTLVNQWEIECHKFDFMNVIKVYSKNPLWKENVEAICFNEKYHLQNEAETSYVIISTYASYARKNVFDALNVFNKRQLLLIADECHNMASGNMLKRLASIPYLRRIGLSATPDRQYDDCGNRLLRKFFGAERNYTYEYSMEDAIKNGVLCKYLYYPHLVRLTVDEMDAYVKLSEKISKYFNMATCSFDKVDEILKRLLLARKRIIHKAANKIEAFDNIIHKRYQEKGNLKYSLVYVPEGNEPNYQEVDEEPLDQCDESDHLIDLFTKSILQLDESITVRKFVSGQKDRDVILQDFATGKLQVLTSMKCLDEGVDVPRSELAIFCSSTGNPRQFIQRRGRVLRMHPKKKLAVIHDLVVAPEVNPNSRSFRMERAMLKNELFRVNNFALLSENPSYSEMELREVMGHYGLNLYNNDNIQ